MERTKLYSQAVNPLIPDLVTAPTNVIWPPSGHPDISKLGDIYPPKEQIFRAFKLCPLNKIKVVILGQDPYPTKGHANGLAFSVNDGIKIPSSLRNIFKQIKNEYEDYNIPNNGDLTRWAKQGVLLLNTALTIKVVWDKGVKNSHVSIWKSYIERIIKLVNSRCEGVVFLLWGAKAHKYMKIINKKKHYILMSSHPSGLSYTKMCGEYSSFKGNKHFKTTNEILKKLNKEEIKW